MNLLAIDTSTEACSVALQCGAERWCRHEITPRKHAEQVLPWIEALCQEAGIVSAQLDAIAVGRGPGGFTGVRLAVAIAQGLAFGLDKPLLPISSLAALAMQAGAAPGERVLAAIDARMGELYLGAYTIDADGLADPLVEEWMAPVGTACPPDAGQWVGVGSGFAAQGGEVAARWSEQLLRHEADRFPHAESILRLAQRDFSHGVRVAPADLEPAYLRDKVAQTLLERGVK